MKTTTNEEQIYSEAFPVGSLVITIIGQGIPDEESNTKRLVSGVAKGIRILLGANGSPETSGMWAAEIRAVQAEFPNADLAGFPTVPELMLAQTPVDKRTTTNAMPDALMTELTTECERLIDEYDLRLDLEEGASSGDEGDASTIPHLESGNVVRTNLSAGASLAVPTQAGKTFRIDNFATDVLWFNQETGEQLVIDSYPLWVIPPVVAHNVGEHPALVVTTFQDRVNTVVSEGVSGVQNVTLAPADRPRNPDLVADDLAIVDHVFIGPYTCKRLEPRWLADNEPRTLVRLPIGAVALPETGALLAMPVSITDPVTLANVSSRPVSVALYGAPRIAQSQVHTYQPETSDLLKPREPNTIGDTFNPELSDEVSEVVAESNLNLPWSLETVRRIRKDPSHRFPFLPSGKPYWFQCIKTNADVRVVLRTDASIYLLSDKKMWVPGIIPFAGEGGSNVYELIGGGCGSIDVAKDTSLEIVYPYDLVLHVTDTKDANSRYVWSVTQKPPVSPLTPFGKKVQELRQSRGMLLGYMASQLWVTPAQLSSVETGEYVVPEVWRKRIPELLNLTPDEHIELDKAIAETDRDRMINSEL